MAVITMRRSIDFSRATASAICRAQADLHCGHRSFSLVSIRMRGFLRHAVVVVCLARSCARIVLPVRLFSPPQRLADQFVGQHQPRLRHVGDRQQHFRRLANGCILAAQFRGFALDAKRMPRKRLRPSIRSSSRSFASWPALRVKSEHRTKGRSMPVKKSPAGIRGSIGSSTSNTGESARDAASQSSIAIVPSGRSAMICTVQLTCRRRARVPAGSQGR